MIFKNTCKQTCQLVVIASLQDLCENPPRLTSEFRLILSTSLAPSTSKTPSIRWGTFVVLGPLVWAASGGTGPTGARGRDAARVAAIVVMAGGTYSND